MAAVVVQDKVEVWLAPRVMLDGAKVHESPAGETDEVRVTVPVNPKIGATVMVEVPVPPAMIVVAVEPAVTEKSGTATLKTTVAP